MVISCLKTPIVYSLNKGRIMLIKRECIPILNLLLSMYIKKKSRRREKERKEKKGKKIKRG